MPTARLTDHDRDSIRTNIRKVASRALWNKSFPISYDDTKEWGYSLLDDEVREKWEWLKKNYPALAHNHEPYHATFEVKHEGEVYTLAGYRLGLPHDDMAVPENHPTASEVGEWAAWYFEMDKQVTAAMKYIGNLINYCHSAGQIKRVLGDDILRFVPQWCTSSLAHAERKSRIPAGLKLDANELTAAANLLALATLSPQEQPKPEIHVVCKNELKG